MHNHTFHNQYQQSARINRLHIASFHCLITHALTNFHDANCGFGFLCSFLLSFQNRLFQLSQSQENSLKQIAAHKEVQSKELKLVEDERHNVQVEVNDLQMKVRKQANVYCSVLSCFAVCVWTPQCLLSLVCFICMFCVETVPGGVKLTRHEQDHELECAPRHSFLY